MPGNKRFLVVLIKPSHYDDDGYVIQWFRSPIPSNSLASVYALVAECAERKVLGETVEIAVEAIDETNTVIPCKKLIQQIREADGGMVGQVGVQSNQFPRAVDLARQFRDADIAVVIGGFHAAGCVSMLEDIPREIREAQALGVSIYAGEAEGRMDVLLRDTWNRQLKPLYNFMKDLPDLEGTTLPFLPAHVIRKMAGVPTSFDAGRGCPFQCSFCTIINVQGRKSRFRTPDDVEQLIRLNAAQGIKRFFVTDDNFARNRNWESILDRMIHLRENEGLHFKIVLQVDTLCYRLPNFIEKAARAGCSRVFIGLENIDPDALAAAKKRQNKIWEYRKMLQAWKDAGVITYAGYILGFPNDTPEKIHRDIEIIKNELPLDMIGVLLPDAPAGLGGPQGAPGQGRMDGPRPQQIRSQPPGRPSSTHVGRRVGEGLSRVLAPVLYGRARGDDLAARGRARRPHEGAPLVHGPLPRLDHDREGPSAGDGNPAAQSALAAPLRPANRKPAVVLSTSLVRNRPDGRTLGPPLSKVQSHIRPRRQGSERQGIRRPVADVDDGRGTARPGHHPNFQGRIPEDPRRPLWAVKSANPDDVPARAVVYVGITGRAGRGARRPQRIGRKLGSRNCYSHINSPQRISRLRESHRPHTGNRIQSQQFSRLV